MYIRILLIMIVMLFSQNAYCFALPKNLVIGAKVVDLNSKQVLLTEHSDYLLYPASNQKIVTLYAAQRLLPDTYRFRTALSTDKENVYIKFSGDPTLTYNKLEELLSKLQKKAYKQIVIDDSDFDREYLGLGWLQDQSEFCFSAPISAAMVDKNCQIFNLSMDDKGKLNIAPVALNFINIENNSRLVHLEDSFCELELSSLHSNKYKLYGCYTKFNLPSSLRIAVNAPEMFTAGIIKNILTKNNVKFKTVTHGVVPKNTELIAEISSDPLQSLLTEMMVNSDNQIAEAIFKKIAQYNSKQPGNWKVGAKIIRELLSKDLLFNDDDIQIYDGSGASKKDLLSADSVIKILQSSYDNKDMREIFLSTFPQAGAEGTVKNRFAELAEIKVLAKTGSAQNTSSLSGYVFAQNGKAFAFSIIINGFISDAKVVKRLEGEIVLSALKGHL